jgi:hypothetical protein
MRRAAILAAGAIALGIAACSSVPADSRIGVFAPDRAQFPPIADFLDHRCGSLDCHGNSQRNLKLYGCEGLRLSSMDVPGCRRQVAGGVDTTGAEYDASFRSIVGLEPQVMSAVVKDGGKHPEYLTFVRKARGEESHKGGALVVPGDDQDKCIASWLTGQTDTDSCTSALMNH